MQKKLAPLAVVVIAAVISVVATAKDLDVPSLWRTCQRDSDCSPITRCGSCCGDDAINKEKIEDYADLYRQECQNARPHVLAITANLYVSRGLRTWEVAISFPEGAEEPVARSGIRRFAPARRSSEIDRDELRSEIVNLLNRYSAQIRGYGCEISWVQPSHPSNRRDVFSERSGSNSPTRPADSAAPSGPAALGIFSRSRQMKQLTTMATADAPTGAVGAQPSLREFRCAGL